MIASATAARMVRWGDGGMRFSALSLSEALVAASLL